MTGKNIRSVVFGTNLKKIDVLRRDFLSNLSEDFAYFSVST